MGEEFKIIQNGIMHLIRAKLRNERKQLKERLSVFRALREQGLHPDTLASLIQEVKDRMPNPQNFNEKQLEMDSDSENANAQESSLFVADY